MPPFRLSYNTMKRLRIKFEEFQHARKTVRKNIESYIEDYRNFQGTPEDRRQLLGDKYKPLAPQMSHLIFDDGENILWHREDIALMLGRDESSVSKVIKRMERSPGWCSRLVALREETKSANNNIIPVYHEGIFGLIFDKYEEEYLERFTRPRRSNNPPDTKEVLRFWEYLKASDHDSLSLTANDDDFADIPPMGWGDTVMLVLRKIATAKTGYIFAALLFMGYELARRWSVLVPVLAAVSSVMLVACVLLLKLRKFRVSLLSEIGAVSVLMAFVWTGALFSGGRVYTPGGAVLTLKTHEEALTLSPELWGKGYIVFKINANDYDNIKEFFYRTNRQGEYVSTGFNYHNKPDFVIEPEIDGEILTLEVKYADIDGHEHGAFTFSYDVAKLRFDLSKNFILNIQDNWLYVSRLDDEATIYYSINEHYADDVVEYMYYGINIDEPDTMFTPSTDYERVWRGSNGSIEYVSSYLVFRDGTKSETRQAK